MTAEFNLSRTELIDLSFSLVHVVEPSADEYALAVKVLNSLVRFLDSKGTLLHAVSNTESTLVTVAGQDSYGTGTDETTIDPAISELHWISVLDPTDRRTLTILDKKTAVSTTLKNDTQTYPDAVYLERSARRSDNKLWIFPTPTSSVTLKYTFRRPLYEFSSATDNPDMPDSFLLPLQKLLAAQLAPHFSLALAERQSLILEGEKEFQEAFSRQSDAPAYVPVRTEFF